MTDRIGAFFIIAILSLILLLVTLSSTTVSHKTLIDKGYGRCNSTTGKFELIPISELKGN